MHELLHLVLADAFQYQGQDCDVPLIGCGV
jgi:hypothetical protein